MPPVSYHGIVGYGKATLPSVEGWNTNNNILRDPPKSIHTRRKDKVGDNMDIIEMIDDSCDRASEAILQYPRGVNPMVKVSYGNHNAGMFGAPTNTSNRPAAKLPYRIGDVFRPPIWRQEDLLPLSRLPRVNFAHTTNPGMPDFAIDNRCDTNNRTNENKRVIIDKIKAVGRSNPSYFLETPSDHGTPYNYIDIDKQYGELLSNVSKYKVTMVDEFGDINPSDYVQDIASYSAVAPLSGIEQDNTNRDDIYLSRNVPEYNYRTNVNKSGDVRIPYENEIQLERNTPLTCMVSNAGTADRVRIDTNRDYNLKNTLSYGGYTPGGNLPSYNTINSNIVNESRIKLKENRSLLSKLGHMNYMDRFQSNTRPL